VENYVESVKNACFPCLRTSEPKRHAVDQKMNIHPYYFYAHQPDRVGAGYALFRSVENAPKDAKHPVFGWFFRKKIELLKKKS